MVGPDRTSALRVIGRPDGRARVGGRVAQRECAPPEPTPVLVGAAALLLVLLFAFGRVVDGLRRDVGTPTRPGPTE